GDRQVLIEHEVEHLPLPFGQRRERCHQPTRRFRVGQRRRGVGPAVSPRSEPGEWPEAGEGVASPLLRGRAPYDREEPRPEARAPLEAGAAVQDLQIARLERVLRGPAVAPAARERPSESRGVQSLELDLKGLGRGGHRALGSVWNWCLGRGTYMTADSPGRPESPGES